LWQQLVWAKKSSAHDFQIEPCRERDTCVTAMDFPPAHHPA